MVGFTETILERDCLVERFNGGGRLPVPVIRQPELVEDARGPIVQRHEAGIVLGRARVPAEGRVHVTKHFHRACGRGVEAGSIGRSDVVELGRILTGEQGGRAADDEITVFDSTGLAVQDLAVAALVYERYQAHPDDPGFADIVKIDMG